MNISNISLGLNIEIDPSTSFNNIIIGDHVKIAKRCSIYGGPDNLLEVGANSYIAQNVNIMADSGPNASLRMQKLFPIEKGPVKIGNHCWIGASAIIMPNVTLGNYCIVAANSFVNTSHPAFSIIGGNPSRLIRSFTEDEKEKMLSA
jgi:acetyltransferase-like isoleucine patch superfamily enzyme